MKETFYFSHDYNAREDAKVQNMMCELGWEGYGLYWATIEKLAEAGGKLCIKDTKGIAFALRVDESKIILLLNDFELFCKNETEFWSNRLLDHIKKRDNLSKTRAKIGKLGGKANAKQLLSKSQANEKQIEAKESKVKESKVKENIPNGIATEVAGVKQVMDIFYKINPTINWGNKTTRQACVDLIKKFGLDGTLKMATQIVEAQGKPYAPVCTTPHQMKEKLAQFKIYFDSQRNKQESNKPKYTKIS